MNFRDYLAKYRNKTATEPASGDDIYELNEVRRDADSDPFLHSLKVLTPDDIAPKPPKRKYTTSEIITEVIRRFIILVCVCVFGWSSVTLVRSFVDYQRGDDLYGSIADNIFNSDLGAGEHAVSLSVQSRASSPIPDYYTGLTAGADDFADELASSSYNVKFEQMKSNLSYMKAINPDIYGYIYIDGTKISFPIVQSDDNEYYLNHAYTGEYMIVGAIFADFRADANIENNRNTVFYGHNMRDGNMFNNVVNFTDEDVFKSKVIEVYTFDGIYTYEPFAIFDALETYQYFRMDFSGDDDFVSFCNEMQDNSYFSKNMTFTGDDKIITLSTCMNDPANVRRYCLQAKLVKVER